MLRPKQDGQSGLEKDISGSKKRTVPFLFNQLRRRCFASVSRLFPPSCCDARKPVKNLLLHKKASTVAALQEPRAYKTLFLADDATKKENQKRN